MVLVLKVHKGEPLSLHNLSEELWILCLLNVFLQDLLLPTTVLLVWVHGGFFYFGVSFQVEI